MGDATRTFCSSNRSRRAGHFIPATLPGIRAPLPDFKVDSERSHGMKKKMAERVGATRHLREMRPAPGARATGQMQLLRVQRFFHPSRVAGRVPAHSAATTEDSRKDSAQATWHLRLCNSQKNSRPKSSRRMSLTPARDRTCLSDQSATGRLPGIGGLVRVHHGHGHLV